MKTPAMAAPVPGYVAVITCPRDGHTLDHVYDRINDTLHGEALARCTNPDCHRLYNIRLTITPYTVNNQPGRTIYA